MIKNQKFYINFFRESILTDTEYFNKKYVQQVKTAQRKLQPDLGSSNHCVIMLTVILTEPDWITVPCDEKLSDFIVCQEIKNNTMKETSIFQDSSLKDIFCKEGHLFIKNKCILFRQYKRLDNLKILIDDQNKINKEKLSSINNFSAEYFSLVQHHFIEKLQFTLIDHSQKTLHTYTLIKSSTYGQYEWMSKVTNEIIAHHDGYLLFPYSYRQVRVPPFLFHCTDGSYVHETLLCNGIDDCSMGIDEKNCVCLNSFQSFGSICNYKCKNGKCRCSDFFYQCSSVLKCIPYLFVCDGYQDCHNGEDEICKINVNQVNNGSQLTSKNETFKCLLSETSIDWSFLNDLIPNCLGSFEDEIQYYNLLTVEHHP